MYRNYSRPNIGDRSYYCHMHGPSRSNNRNENAQSNLQYLLKNYCPQRINNCYPAAIRNRPSYEKSFVAHEKLQLYEGPKYGYIQSGRTSRTNINTFANSKTFEKSHMNIDVTEGKILHDLQYNSKLIYTKDISQRTRASTINPKLINTPKKYIIEGQIGKGAYAIVKSGIRNGDGKEVAIKIYEKYMMTDRQRKECINEEISVLKRLNHPHIMGFYDTFETSNQIFIVTELIKGQSLSSYVASNPGRKLCETEAFRIFAQIVDGIVYCHERNVVHRDIKMSNILLDNKQEEPQHLVMSKSARFQAVSVCNNIFHL